MPHDDRSLFSEGDTHHITYYFYIGETAVAEGIKGATRGYHAYYKPDGWLNFGQSITTPGPGKFYTTLKAAKDACKQHLVKFGANPSGLNCRL